jgi:uncharacterized protein
MTAFNVDGLQGALHMKLTTFRQNGTPVSTPVHVAVEGDRAFFRTWDPTGKLKRIRRNPDVVVAPSTVTGNATGPAMEARATILNGADSEHAAELLGRRYGLLHSWLIPAYHRLRGWRTVQLELRPRPQAKQP